MLTDLKNFDANRASIDEMVSLRAECRTVVTEYEVQNVATPDWVEPALTNLDRQIKAKNAERLEARKREVTLRLDNLKTPNEKKIELRKELAQLNKELVNQ